jgi:tripartite-type tricarboxylate transporter receptor subunit TctC
MKIISLLISLMLALTVNAQNTIEFVVSAAAGGPNDTVTRKIVEKLEQSTQLKFIILNKPGAAHVIAYNYVLNSDRPMLIMSTPEISKHLVYTQVDELYNAGYFSNTLFVSEKSSIKSLKQLEEVGKTREILFGHGGVGTYSYMAMDIVCEKTLRCLKVPYKSGANGMLAVMSGEIDAYAIANYGSKQFFENTKIVPIFEINATRDKSWFKLFSKNMSLKDKETIVNILTSEDVKFYNDMGFKK